MFRALLQLGFYWSCALVQLADKCVKNPAEAASCLRFLLSLLKK